MPNVTMPFPIQTVEEAHNGDPFSCSLYKMLPEVMQTSTKDSVYLLEYLHTLPIKEIGLPEYHPSPSRELGDMDSLNVIYPVEGGLFIHVINDPEGGRGYYISIEPRLSRDTDEAVLLHRTELELLNYAMEFEGTETPEEQRVVLERILDRLYGVHPSGAKSLK